MLRFNDSVIPADSSNQVGSFIQDQRHLTKTERFKAIQPAQIQEVLTGHGFDLVNLRAGRARKADRVNHQTTIARYRSKTPMVIDGLYMDLVFKVPHLYGALEAFLGTYRLVCSNGLTVGTKFISAKVRHTGNPQEELASLIPSLVGQHDQLTETIKFMQAREVNASELASLAQRVAALRLSEEPHITNVQAQDLLNVRRQEDRSPTLWNAMNVVQENVMRFGLRYQSRKVDDQGNISYRNMVARPVGYSRSHGDIESARSISLNASIWDAATELLTA